MKAVAALWCLAVAATHAAAAPATGAPGSATCSQALRQLRELEDRVLAAPREQAEVLRRQMLQSRRAAALACLGESGDADTPQPSRITAPPPRGLVPPALPSLRLPNPAPPARVPSPDVPRTLGACDANGCWTNDGIRLQRIGPQLLGPRGVCSTAGNAVQCP